MLINHTSMQYHVLTDPEKIGLEDVFVTQGKMLEKQLRRPVDKHVVTEFDGDIADGKREEVIIEEEQEVQKATFLLRLVKL